MNAHFDLPVWDRAHRLTASIYRLMSRMPREERQGLGNELCRAAADVAVLVSRAEHETAKQDKVALLRAAQRCAAETESLLVLLSELQYLNRKMVGVLVRENQQIQKMLHHHRQTACPS